MSLWWFLLIIGNMSAPVSLNLIGEINLLMGLISYSSSFMGFIFFLSFFSCVYSLYMYSFSQHGIFYSGLFSISSCYLVEFHLVFLHWFFIFLLCLA